MTAAVLLLLAFVLVCALGPCAIAFCRGQGLVADITDRHAHAVPTPHGGGIVIVLVGVVLGMLALQLGTLPNELFLSVLLVASLAVAGVGWLDDKHELSARTRLLVHLSAVSLALAVLPPLFDFMPLWLEKLILLLAWGWFLNLTNFMDGADGYSASAAIWTALGLAMLAPELAPLAGVIIGAALGFLVFNWAPARVFMGDVGSTWLGYMLGGLLLLALVDDTWRMVAPLATLPLLFCADATWTLVRRMKDGHKPWHPHKEFWFHRAMRLGLCHKRLAWRANMLHAALFVLALGGYAFDMGIAPLAAGLVLLGWRAWRIRHLERAAGLSFNKI